MISSQEHSGELAALRRRAYGPDADIQSDPVALRRLDELEAEWRRQTVVSEDPEPSGSVEEAPDPGNGDSGPMSAARTASSPARPWWRTWWAISAVSLAVGLIIGGAGALQLSSRPPAPAPDVSLGVVSSPADRSEAWTANLSSWGVTPSSVRHYRSFETIDVWAGDTPYDDRCLLLSYEGRIFMAQCAATGLDPVLDLSVDAALPVQLGDTIPYGTMIRFVAHYATVDVWTRQGPVAVTSPDPAARTG